MPESLDVLYWFIVSYWMTQIVKIFCAHPVLCRICTHFTLLMPVESIFWVMVLDTKLTITRLLMWIAVNQRKSDWLQILYQTLCVATACAPILNPKKPSKASDWPLTFFFGCDWSCQGAHSYVFSYRVWRYYFSGEPSTLVLNCTRFVSWSHCCTVVYSCANNFSRNPDFM